MQSSHEAQVNAVMDKYQSLRAKVRSMSSPTNTLSVGHIDLLPLVAIKTAVQQDWK